MSHCSHCVLLLVVPFAASSSVPGEAIRGGLASNLEWVSPAMLQGLVPKASSSRASQRCPVFLPALRLGDLAAAGRSQVMVFLPSQIPFLQAAPYFLTRAQASASTDTVSGAACYRFPQRWQRVFFCHPDRARDHQIFLRSLQSDALAAELWPE